MPFIAILFSRTFSEFSSPNAPNPSGVSMLIARIEDKAAVCFNPLGSVVGHKHTPSQGRAPSVRDRLAAASLPPRACRSEASKRQSVREVVIPATELAPSVGMPADVAAQSVAAPEEIPVPSLITSDPVPAPSPAAPAPTMAQSAPAPEQVSAKPGMRPKARWYKSLVLRVGIVCAFSYLLLYVLFSE